MNIIQRYRAKKQARLAEKWSAGYDVGFDLASAGKVRKGVSHIHIRNLEDAVYYSGLDAGLARMGRSANPYEERK